MRFQENIWTGWKDKQTLFNRTFLATSGGPTSTTAVGWHLNVKYTEYDVSLTKNFGTQSACKKSAQFINLFLRYNRF